MRDWRRAPVVDSCVVAAFHRHAEIKPILRTTMRSLAGCEGYGAQERPYKNQKVIPGCVFADFRSVQLQGYESLASHNCLIPGEIQHAGRSGLAIPGVEH